MVSVFDAIIIDCQKRAAKNNAALKDALTTKNEFIRSVAKIDPLASGAILFAFLGCPHVRRRMQVACPEQETHIWVAEPRYIL